MLPLQVTVHDAVLLHAAVHAPLQVMLHEPVPLHATSLPAPTVAFSVPVLFIATVEFFPAVTVVAPVPFAATLQLSPQVPVHEPVLLQVKMQLAVLALQVPSPVKSQLLVPLQMQVVPTQKRGPPQPNENTRPSAATRDRKRRVMGEAAPEPVNAARPGSGGRAAALYDYSR